MLVQGGGVRDWLLLLLYTVTCAPFKMPSFFPSAEVAVGVEDVYPRGTSRVLYCTPLPDPDPDLVPVRWCNRFNRTT